MARTEPDVPPTELVGDAEAAILTLERRAARVRTRVACVYLVLGFAASLPVYRLLAEWQLTRLFAHSVLVTAVSAGALVLMVMAPAWWLTVRVWMSLARRRWVEKASDDFLVPIEEVEQAWSESKARGRLALL